MPICALAPIQDCNMKWKMVDVLRGDGSKGKMGVFEARRFIFWGESLNYEYIRNCQEYVALADECLTVIDVAANPCLITTEMRKTWQVYHP